MRQFLLVMVWNSKWLSQYCLAWLQLNMFFYFYEEFWITKHIVWSRCVYVFNMFYRENFQVIVWGVVTLKSVPFNKAILVYPLQVHQPCRTKKSNGFHCVGDDSILFINLTPISTRNQIVLQLLRSCHYYSHL